MTLPSPLRPQVRLQIAGGGSPLGVLAEIVKKEGFGTLYTGLSAGILRQITYTSSRMGIFKCAPHQPPSPAACPPGGRVSARLCCLAAPRRLGACLTAPVAAFPLSSPNRKWPLPPPASSPAP